MTFQKLQDALHITQEQASQAFQEVGLLLSEDIRENRREISDREVEKLRPVMMRYYRSVKVPKERVARTEPTATRQMPDVPDHADFKEPSVEKVLKNDSVPQSVSTQPPEPAPEAPPSTPEPPALPEPENAMDVIAANHVIMIDTCSWMHHMCGKMVDALLPSLKKYGKKVIIPDRVRRELLKHRDNPYVEDRAIAAQKGLEACQKLQDAGCLTVKGSENDNFADNTFFVQFSHYCLRYHMLLITQDYALTQDILSLNTIGSRRGYPVRVMRITGTGGLAESRL